VVQDPKIFKGKTPYSYSLWGDNCTTYARDAWYYYSGEWTYLPGPDRPEALEAWIRQRNRVKEFDWGDLDMSVWPYH